MNRLRELRKEKNLSQTDVAKAIGVGTNTISRYEKGDREPKLGTWRALADYFDVSVPYLRGATTYEILDLREKGIYGYVTEAMDRAFNDYPLLPVQKERVLKAIAYSIDDGEFN